MECLLGGTKRIFSYNSGVLIPYMVRKIVFLHMEFCGFCDSSNIQDCRCYTPWHRIHILSRCTLPLKYQKSLLKKLTYNFMCTHKKVWPFLLDFHEMALYAHMFVCFWCDSPQLARASSFTMFLDHTQWRTTVGSTSMCEWSSRRRDLYLTAHNTHNRQTSMPLMGFEPTISTGERPQTYTLDRAATGTGYMHIYCNELHQSGVVCLCVENIGKNLFTPVLKTRLSLGRFYDTDNNSINGFWQPE